MLEVELPEGDVVTNAYAVRGDVEDDDQLYDLLLSWDDYLNIDIISNNEELTPEELKELGNSDIEYLYTVSNESVQNNSSVSLPIEYKGFIIDKDKVGGWIVKYPDGAHLFEYRPDMPLSQVKADLTRSINKGEVNSTLIKEEYGYFRGTIPCDVIGEQLEYNSWSGYVDDEEWTLDINGFRQEDFFTMDVADYMTYDISYPVKDGHLSYIGLDIIMYQNWLANPSADVDSIKHDLMLLCDDTDAINKFLAGEVEELEFSVDYDVNFDMDAWEDSFYSDYEDDEEELEEV